MKKVRTGGELFYKGLFSRAEKFSYFKSREENYKKGNFWGDRNFFEAVLLKYSGYYEKRRIKYAM